MISGQAIVLAEVAANDAVDQVRVLFSDPVVPARGLDEGQVGYARAAAYFRETGDADLVVPATWSRTPLLDDGDVMPGAHVTSLGADEPGKAELTPALLTAGRVFVDDVPLALTAGALGTAALSAADAVGTLSQVLQGIIPGRRTDADITIYTPVGLPWQDLALAWAAYCQARDTGLGREFDFLA